MTNHGSNPCLRRRLSALSPLPVVAVGIAGSWRWWQTAGALSLLLAGVVWLADLSSALLTAPVAVVGLAAAIDRPKAFEAPRNALQLVAIGLCVSAALVVAGRPRRSDR